MIFSITSLACGGIYYTDIPGAVVRNMPHDGTHHPNLLFRGDLVRNSTLSTYVGINTSIIIKTPIAAEALRLIDYNKQQLY